MFAQFKIKIYLCINKLKQHQVMTTQEIKIKGFRLVEETATAMMNVFNGCKADQAIVDANMARLPKMIEWFKTNDLMPDLRYYMSLPKWNVTAIRFHMAKLSEMINNL